MCSLCFSLVSSSEAQELQIPPRISDFINDVTNEAVNASMIFAADDAVSNGHFVLRRSPQPDKKYDSFKLPGEYVFGERGQTWRPLVRGSFSHVKITLGLFLPEDVFLKFLEFVRSPGFSLIGLLVALQVLPYLVRPVMMFAAQVINLAG